MRNSADAPSAVYRDPFIHLNRDPPTRVHSFIHLRKFCQYIPNPRFVHVFYSNDHHEHVLYQKRSLKPPTLLHIDRIDIPDDGAYPNHMNTLHSFDLLQVSK